MSSVHKMLGLITKREKEFLVNLQSSLRILRLWALIQNVRKSIKSRNIYPTSNIAALIFSETKEKMHKYSGYHRTNILIVIDQINSQNHKHFNTGL